MGLNIDKAYVGSSEVDKIYLGAELVWQAIACIPVEGAPNGVYILHTDGNLYFPKMWNKEDNENAVGVALVSDNCKFVIAPELSNEELQWSKGGVRELVPGVTDEDGNSEIRNNDFNGKENTRALIIQYGESTDYAAGWCNNYTFKNNAHGYLAGYGEFYEVVKNKDAILDCMSLIDGDTNFGNFYWTSTQYYYYGANVISFNGGAGMQYKDDLALVRPIAQLT